MGAHLGQVHLHMHPPMASFLPAYHYDSGMGLTLYHHNHYVHYSVFDMVLRAILTLILFTIFICLICYLIGMCMKSSQE